MKGSGAINKYREKSFSLREFTNNNGGYAIKLLGTFTVFQRGVDRRHWKWNCWTFNGHRIEAEKPFKIGIGAGKRIPAIWSKYTKCRICLFWKHHRIGR
jgi:hypothetical protein